MIPDHVLKVKGNQFGAILNMFELCGECGPQFTSDRKKKDAICGVCGDPIAVNAPRRCPAKNLRPHQPRKFGAKGDLIHNACRLEVRRESGASSPTKKARAPSKLKYSINSEKHIVCCCDVSVGATGQ